MQRFTKEYLKAQNLALPGYSEDRHQLYVRLSDPANKSLYVLSEAARYRASAMQEMHRYPGETVADYRRFLKHIRVLLSSARRWGCVLP